MELLKTSQLNKIRIGDRLQKERERKLEKYLKRQNWRVTKIIQIPSNRDKNDKDLQEKSFFENKKIRETGRENHGN